MLKISLLNNGTSKPSAEVFLRTEPTKEGDGEIVGLAVSTVSSSMFVNIRHRGLFAYMTRGQLLWSAGPVIDRYGYQQGCRKNYADCYFNSVPVIDQCEASIYVRSASSLLFEFSCPFLHLYSNSLKRRLHYNAYIEKPNDPKSLKTANNMNPGL